MTEGVDDYGNRVRFPDNCPHCEAGLDWGEDRTFFFFPENGLRFACGGCGREFTVWPEPADAP